MSDTVTIITAITTTGLALAGLVLYLFRWLRQEVRTYIAALNSRMEAMEARLHSRIGSLISLFPRPGSAA